MPGNPYTKIGKDMDALPDRNKRLITGDYWDSDVGGGCLVGTLVTGSSRLRAFSDKYAVSVDAVDELVQANDNFFQRIHTDDANRMRFGHMRREITQREAKWKATD